MFRVGSFGLEAELPLQEPSENTIKPLEQPDHEFVVIKEVDFANIVKVMNQRNQVLCSPTNI